MRPDGASSEQARAYGAATKDRVRQKINAARTVPRRDPLFRLFQPETNLYTGNYPPGWSFPGDRDKSFPATAALPAPCTFLSGNEKKPPTTPQKRTTSTLKNKRKKKQKNQKKTKNK